MSDFMIILVDGYSVIGKSLSTKRPFDENPKKEWLLTTNGKLFKDNQLLHTGIIELNKSNLIAWFEMFNESKPNG